MNIQKCIELINYRISEGSDYCWSCYGPNAYCIDSNSEKYSLTFIFDKETQHVYELNVFDYVNDRAFRYIDKDYKSLYENEAKVKNINDFALDDIKWIDLEIEEDFFTKAKAIINGQSYDTRILINLEFDESELLTLFKKAHELDLTFNQFVEKALINYIENNKNNLYHD